MTKREKYCADLTDLFSRYLQPENFRPISKYLEENSGLPGPRGNLELAFTFGDFCREYAEKYRKEVWDMCLQFSESEILDLKDDPSVFTPFCGILGLGAAGSLSGQRCRKAFKQLRPLSSHSNWRIREAVPKAINSMLFTQTDVVLDEIRGWIGEDNWLPMRSVAAGMIESGKIADETLARQALELHHEILIKVHENFRQKDDAFTALRKGLAFTLSVAVMSLPGPGFELMRSLLKLGDSNIEWIIRENLKKSRLLKNFPAEVAELKKLAG